MKGGYQIFDLSGLDMQIKSVQTSITDPKILNQLDNLKGYIQNDYTFEKPLNNQLKPVLLRIRDKAQYEKQESAVWCNLSVKTDKLTFVIEGVVDSVLLKVIQIEVVFELKTNEVGEHYYGIKTAKYLLTTNLQSAHLSVGSMGVNGNIEVGGKVIGKTEFEQIVDAQNHNRFIEGDITCETITGVTQTYGKWSLSGTHLMIVIVIDLEDESVISYGKLADINVPEWILDKIVPITSSNLVNIRLANAYASDFSAQDIFTYLIKNNGLWIDIGGVTLTKHRTLRVQFDLLIDNEQPQNE